MCRQCVHASNYKNAQLTQNTDQSFPSQCDIKRDNRHARAEVYQISAVSAEPAGDARGVQQFEPMHYCAMEDFAADIRQAVEDMPPEDIPPVMQALREARDEHVERRRALAEGTAEAKAKA